MTSHAYRFIFGSDSVLRAVNDWAIGYEIVREFKLSESLRVDALLVPTSWNVVQGVGRYWPRDVPSWARMGLLGVEVKNSRADFLAGLRRNQYQDYAAHPGIMGLYLATPRDVIHKGELPAGIGHLVCAQRPEQGLVCVSRARPKYRPEQATPEALWRIMFRLREQYDARLRKAVPDHNGYKERFGEIVGGLVARMGRDAADLAARKG